MIIKGGNEFAVEYCLIPAYSHMVLLVKYTLTVKSSVCAELGNAVTEKPRLDQLSGCARA